MAVNLVSVGDILGVLPSAAYVIIEIGRYAEPQVPRTLFNERREVFSYTAGLFVGAILTILYVLLQESISGGGLISAIIWLAALIAVLELGQYLIGRSIYFGSDNALPFYVLGYRSGAAGLLGIVVFAGYLSHPPFTVTGVLGTALEAGAFVLLLVAAGIQSTPRGPPDARRPGQLGRGVILEVFGFLLLALGQGFGDVGVVVAAIAVAGGSYGLYLNHRDDVLGTVRPPPREGGPDDDRTPPKGRFGRQDAVDPN